MKPPYAPNVVNQTVDYGGYTWKGNPGGDWQMMHPTGNGPQDQQAKADAYGSAIGSAVGGLETQKTNLSDQYGSLLQTVTGQYQPLINQTTASAGGELARRGINPDSFFYKQNVQGALQPVYSAEAGNAQQIGQGSINDINTLTQAIANLKAGGAGTVAQLPLQYGSLALAQAANIANIGLAGSQAAAAGASSRYIPIPGVGLWDTQSGQFVGNQTNNNLNSGGYQILNVP